ncbi:MAG: type II toxin-antitoxin system RelE/ParE family toxin [Endozoicomonas sp.]|uniref:type II toxin-antitoxin system RelE/ParE family toxin n=1 Tax=Endozoicomonas sp. TaxID=1892382 RepID=UPI003D9BCAC3
MIRWAEEAINQLEAHYAFMAMVGDYDPEAVIEQMLKAVEQLVYNPKTGREMESGLYKLTLKKPKFVIHYQVAEEIIIVGIYHHRQNRPI